MKVIKVKICDQEKIIPKRPSFAIKAKCIDCSGGEYSEVINCSCTDCPLYEYRGWFRWESKYDFTIKKEITKEQAERLNKMRNSNKTI